VRHHMLEPDDTDDRIRALIGNFENLNRAHDAVVRARSQIDALDPLVAHGDRLQTLEADAAIKRRARDVLAAWFATHRIRLIDERIDELNFEQNKAQQQLEAHPGASAPLPLRGHRRSIRPWLRRQHSIWTGALQESRPAAPDSDTAAEDRSHRRRYNENPG
jgi:hypothetical protein